MAEVMTTNTDATIPLADDFTLPLDAATSTFGILGKKGRGKTHTAAVLAEGLIKSGVPTTILDPTGAWYGLRSSADGKAAGLPVVIFGGEHGDAPLTPTMGTRIAEILVERRFPAVLDLSVLRKNERRRFATDFLETLYQLNRLAHHVVIDEADEVAPQRAYAGVERLLGATEDIVRRGRIRGLGVSMISQRPAALSKSVLSQVDALIVLGLTAPQDVAAVDDWVSSHSDPDQARTLKASLPSLPVGQAWVWSPEWLGITKRIQVQRRSTFDSSSTPKAGARRIVPTEWAAVDVAEIHDQLNQADTAAGGSAAQTNARIRELEQQLEAARNQPRQTVRVEVPVLSDAEVAHLNSAVTQLASLGRNLVETATNLSAALARATEIRAADATTQINGYPADLSPTVPKPLSPAPQGTPQSSSSTLGKAEREILTVLAQHGTRNTTQIALLTRRSHKSGGFRNSLSKLRSAGFIDGRGDVSITTAGRAALGTWEPLPQQGTDLIRWWGTQLGKAERLVLDYLATKPDCAVPVDEIALQTGYSPTSGGFRNSLSRLRSLGLASGRGALQISNELIA
ncbi:ATP-binding protein [Mycobacteroides abscessus]|uniref:AAA-like domain n=1 Tax=Mycobacteroides abscessus TaxID=36809 RepID=A0A0U0ZRF9_9MYCO|nr:helicase HerA-like domain-containing protein [Mycobacteroides abscessus]CPV66902.1 AAA-like domain [Mycobacteroides abscessus]